MKASSIFILALFLVNVACKTKEEWKSRSIYQILTDRFAKDGNTEGNCNLSQYCGGNYKGVIKKLDYIKGMGFDAIWISPIVKNLEGSYHGYHLTNLYEVNEHFGTKQDLIDLVNECHKRDIWVMVDVVGNHVAPVGTDYSQITPFNLPEHYHDRCDITDWNNQWQVENCRLADLPDLKQENSWVTDKLYEWIKNLVKEYNFDGIRIDTIMEVPKNFWIGFKENAGVFQIGEAFNGNVDYVADYQNYLDSVFNYPLYYTIQYSFCGSFRNLESYWFNSRNKFPNPPYMATFTENHDNPRFLNRCNDRNHLRNAIAFALVWEGIPVFYYGQEQYYAGGADPNNREPLWDNYNTDSEVYKMLKKIHDMRKKQNIFDENTVQRYADDNFYAFTRGKKLLACFTNQYGISRTITYHEFSEGQRLCNALDTNDCVQVSGKAIQINMQNDPKLYVPV